MRERLGVPQPSRVRGRPALSRRLRWLGLAVNRFGEHRAVTPADLRWTAVAMDGLLLAVLHQAARLRYTPVEHHEPIRGLR